MAWIADNLPTIITGMIVVMMVVMLLWSRIRDRKRGGCGCGCPGCTGGCSHLADAKDKMEGEGR
ncbi:MAG: FeoB-associated Cys-rich membrane protein [Butyrivibrio sp.]|nr:FeoB-associated Cys-rich membrane protein [Butyrivibrio sp.]